MKGNEKKELRKVTHFDAYARRRYNKRQYYFTIEASYVRNRLIIINNWYLLKVYYKGKLIKEYWGIARKKGKKEPKHYFTIKKEDVDDKIIIINIEYHIEIFC